MNMATPAMIINPSFSIIAIDSRMTVNAGSIFESGIGRGNNSKKPDKEMSKPHKGDANLFSDIIKSRGLEIYSRNLINFPATFRNDGKKRFGTFLLKSDDGNHGFCPRDRRIPISKTMIPEGVESPKAGTGVQKGIQSKIRKNR